MTGRPNDRDFLHHILFSPLHFHERSTYLPPRPCAVSWCPRALYKMASLRCVNAPSSARLFVQLAKRSVGGAQASRNPATLPVLDIFVPGWKAEGSGRSSFTTKRQSHTLPSTLPRKTASNIVQTRSFTASAVRRATTCVCNPQQDEDGNGMNIEITDRAGKVCMFSFCSLFPFPLSALGLVFSTESAGSPSGWSGLFEYIVLTSNPPSASLKSCKKTRTHI